MHNTPWKVDIRKDGSRQIVGTEGKWKVSDGDVTDNATYDYIVNCVNYCAAMALPSLQEENKNMKMNLTITVKVNDGPNEYLKNSMDFTLMDIMDPQIRLAMLSAMNAFSRTLLELSHPPVR